jgi:transposase, IS30 family
MGAVYSQLNITERRRIERWRHAKVPVNEMARVLGRCRSTIFRELKRNHFSDPCMPKCDGYYGAAAQLVAAGRRARQRKLIKYPALTKRVVERLKNGWTPEQIGYQMIHEQAPLRVCQETIYRYIYSKEGMAQELWRYLPTHRIAQTQARS